jgi:beta-fructofuranosidase
MARGNYAGRVCRDENGWLLWCFYTTNPGERTTNNLMPPPKRLTRTSDGLLRVRSFEGFDEWLAGEVDTQCVHALKEGLGAQQCSVDGRRLELMSEAGFQAFVFDEPLGSFRFRSTLRLKGKGKCGLIFRVDPATHDGYYLSLDLLKGIAQLRSWQTGERGSGEQMMQFREMQSGYWLTETPGEARVELLAFGSYIEFSVDGRVILSLVDQTFTEGLLGVSLETAHLEISDVELNHMASPLQSDDHLVMGETLSNVQG